VQAAVASATRTCRALTTRLAILAQKKAEVERQLAAERERIARAAAANELSSHVTAIEDALLGYLKQSRVLVDALSSGGWTSA
jgi:hypothetical protein